MPELTLISSKESLVEQEARRVLSVIDRALRIYGDAPLMSAPTASMLSSQDSTLTTFA